MTKNQWRKGIAILAAISFFILAATPQALATAPENKSQAIRVQAYGIKRTSDKTIELTQSQCQSLDHYLVTFRDRLNHTTTTQSTAALFREAVVEFEKYDLLPQGLTIRQAQDLVTGQKQRQYLINFNLFSLIAGSTSSNTVFIPPLARLLSLMYLCFGSNEILSTLLLALLAATVLLSKNSPIAVWDWITFGYMASRPSPHMIPADGWLNSIGLLGVKKWDMLTGIVIGFTGLKVWYKDTATFLGTGLIVAPDMNL
jgi:hypothetical protein